MATINPAQRKVSGAAGISVRFFALAMVVATVSASHSLRFNRMAARPMNTLAVAVIVAAYLALTLTAAIRSEEAFLRRTFGGDYDAYKRTGIVDTARRFSLSRALANREYRAVAGLLAALLLMAWKATYNGAF